MRPALLALLLFGCTVDVDIDGEPALDAGPDAALLDAGSTDAGIVDAGPGVDAAARTINDPGDGERP